MVDQHSTVQHICDKKVDKVRIVPITRLLYKHSIFLLGPNGPDVGNGNMKRSIYPLRISLHEHAMGMI